MKLLFYCVVLLFIPLTIFGQSPRFQNYPTIERYVGRPVAPKLTPGTAAWNFRTRIREAARDKPNFAGRYILATWGCGAECVSYAILDARTGAVYCDDVTVCCFFNGEGANLPADFEPVDFRLNSRLVVFTGLLNEQGANGPHYFKFERGRLLPVPRRSR